MATGKAFGKSMPMTAWGHQASNNANIANLADDAVQLGLFEPKELQLEGLHSSIDRLRAKYGHRCLQTGLTFFDPYVNSPDWEPYRHTGLSSQVGRDAPTT